ncbi:MAG TPA: sulfatase [Acidimicrobiales bacterium]|nr:sulfatase [Acidimicrobiales bacterium]
MTTSWRRPAAIACFAVVLSASIVGVAAAQTGASRPNIVFVLTDDLSPNLVTAQFMPNLWALEQQGAQFTNYFVTDSLCCPSRASIFTGRYPHDTGVFNNSGADGGYGAFQANGDEYSTVATDLHTAGYRTAMMGKYLNRYQTNDPPGQGWDAWDVANWGYPEFHYDLNENGRIVDYGGAHRPGKVNYLTDVLSGLADSFVTNTTTNHPSQPFFLEVASFAPHEPYTPAPRYADLYPNLTYPVTPAFDAATIHAPSWLGDRPPITPSQLGVIDTAFRKRAESVKSVDDLIGSLTATLRQTGQLANTYFVFSSDNGLHMGEHRLMPGKLTAFDTDIHVPLVVVGPKVSAGSNIQAFAENIDLRSTFDALAGTQPSEAVDGRSLTPLLIGPAGPSAVPSGWPKGVLVEHHGPDGASAGPDRPAPRSGDPPTYEALRLSNGLYVEYATGEREYYDLATDPYEIDNVYSSLAPQRIVALHRELVALENCHDSPSCSQVAVPTS